MGNVLQIGEYTFRSRLIVGTGKYQTFDLMRDALVASGTELVTVALRRVNLDNPSEPSLLDFIPKNVRILPNTAGCYTAKEAIAVAHLAKAAGIGTLVKLEIIGDQELLWPDPIETLEATKVLVQEGFTVMVYTTPDPVLAKYLDKAGAHAIMPLGSPIGSGQGVLDVEAVRRFKQRVSVPVIVDAGIGSPQDACLAMENGADAVLINTAIAQAGDPVMMAQAMKWAVEAGRLGFEAGRMPKRQDAVASSPTTGMIAAGQ
ncbi:thiazole synthase [Sulfobacillus thermosulfidooxidans]|uniref:thiazole synthase n=1 Tax=Sulfobacillus thermosulfidooxidans TaxID=28034 RepID=UPI0004266F8E|nr:thiazole synthase [Sulfobacillus thermosulfidooxidans]